MEREWFTIGEIEKETNIPHQTIRRYIKTHGHYLILKKKHKSYFISVKSVNLILKIRNMYSDGKTSEQVDEYLANSGIPITISISRDDEQVEIDFVGTLIELKNNMNSLHDRFEQQEKFNKLLVEKLADQNDQMIAQQKYIDEKLNQRDVMLINSLREILETKKQISAAAQPKKKWWKFW